MDVSQHTNKSAPDNKYSTFLYPGSFDPVTLGHQDMIIRAVGMCSRLIVAVGYNQDKKAMFPIDERVDMLRNVVDTLRAAGTPGMEKVEISQFDGLLVDFANEAGAGIIIKGLRAATDFEYEYQMALLNRHLNNNIDTIFLMTSGQYAYLSSRAVKIIALNGGCLDGLVPVCVSDRIRKYVKMMGDNT